MGDDQKNPDKVRAAQARSEALTPNERSEIARKAALARWDPEVPVAERRAVVKIGGIDVQCYVLKDGRRLLHKRGMATVLGMKSTGGNAFMKVMSRKGIRSKFAPELAECIANPIVIKESESDPRIAHCYEH